MKGEDIYIALHYAHVPLNKVKIICEHECDGIPREYEPKSFRLAMRDGEPILIISDDEL